MLSDNLLLTSLWLVPLIGVAVVLLLPKRSEQAAKWVSLGFTSVTFLITLVILGVYLLGSDSPNGPRAALAARADSNKLVESGGVLTGVQDQEGDLLVRRAWIPSFNIQYYLGVDGISLSLVVLTGLVSVLASLASWNIDKHVKGYFALYLLLTASMLGVFISLDLFLFYVFFEVMLLPMYFLIAIWGGPRREYAAIKFLLYTLFGSVFILVAILILYFWQSRVAVPGFTGHSFDCGAARVDREQFKLLPTVGPGLGVHPVFHRLHRQASLVPIPHVATRRPRRGPDSDQHDPGGDSAQDRRLRPDPACLAACAGRRLRLVDVCRGPWSLQHSLRCAVAMAQTDFKKLVAYSSVSHMGYVTLGMAVMTIFAADGSAVDPRYYAYGVNGAMYMMLAHGITSAGMFFLVGVIYDRAHTRDLNKLGGLGNIMPLYAAISYIIFFGSMGLPGLCGFVAEVFVVLAAFNYSPLLAILAAAAVILTAGYILWTVHRVFLGRSEAWKGLPDLSGREIGIAVPLVVLTIAMGIFPQQLILSWMGPSVDQVVQSVTSAREINAGAQARPVVIRTTDAPATNDRRDVAQVN